MLDSPFSNLKVLAEELAKQYAKLPGFITSTALSFIKKTVKAKADFDIDNLSPIDHVCNAFIPAFFVAGKDDTFIVPEHTKKLYEAYSGDKNIAIVDGDHNAPRP